jgi:hypothetical protein
MMREILARLPLPTNSWQKSNLKIVSGEWGVGSGEWGVGVGEEGFSLHRCGVFNPCIQLIGYKRVGRFRATESFV